MRDTVLLVGYKRYRRTNSFMVDCKEITNTKTRGPGGIRTTVPRISISKIPKENGFRTLGRLRCFET